MTEPWSVHDQPDFERTYDEDDVMSVRRGDLRALLDLATGSMDFGSGFLDNEQVEILRQVAEVLGIDPAVVTPDNFKCVYYGKAHRWYGPATDRCHGPDRSSRWWCINCDASSQSVDRPE